MATARNGFTMGLGIQLAGWLLAAQGLLWSASLPDLSAVPWIDVQKCEGKWYEIARLPNLFEGKCAQNVIAEYELRPDGRMEVRNTCLEENGRTRQMKGTARPADPKGPNSKLKVTFFWPFSSNFWVLGIDPNYRWVMVGEPSRRYLWIMSRSPKLETKIYDHIVGLARSLRFETSRLVRVKQADSTISD